jgi:catechol 2,3-dioxygenase-like lactoylglutathione lyase family enzyme
MKNSSSAAILADPIKEHDMALVQEFGYLVYGVTDLDETVDFFRTVCQLEVSERRDDSAFLTGDTKHAWIRLERRAQPGLIRLGFRAEDAAALEEIKTRLDAAGPGWTPGGSISGDRIDNAIRFTCPGGFEVEVYEEQVVLPESPAPARGLERALHPVVFVENITEGRDFFKQVLGFHRSDQIEELVVFLRCGNGYHHSLALAKGEPGRLDHLALLVDGIDTVVRFRNHARALGVKAEDLVRHTASGSISAYVEVPALGIGVEFCAGPERILDESYNGRLLKAGPVTADRWSAGFPAVTPEVYVGRGGGTRAGEIASLSDAQSQEAQSKPE